MLYNIGLFIYFNCFETKLKFLFWFNILGLISDEFFMSRKDTNSELMLPSKKPTDLYITALMQMSNNKYHMHQKGLFANVFSSYFF